MRDLAADGRVAADLTPSDLDAAARSALGHPLEITAADLAVVLDPAAVVASRTGTGGAAPGAVDAMVSEIRATAERLQVAADGLLSRFDGAEAEVRARTRRLAGGRRGP